MRNTTPQATNSRARATPLDRSDMPQYSLRQILAVWAASRSR
jgi:hypothetical protein